MGYGQAARSPFLPPVVEAPAATVVVEDAELQFCGTFGGGENKRFLIYNLTTRRSTWLRLGQEGPDELYVDDFDPVESTIMVRQGGRALTLAMSAARLAGGGGGANPAPVPLAGNPEDLVNTVRVNPTPADERRRLEAVAAEVRRRRAARAAAASGAPNPPDPR